jgi:hypothetical protein
MKMSKLILFSLSLFMPVAVLAQNLPQVGAPSAGNSEVGGSDFNDYYDDLIGSEFDDSPADPSSEFFGFTQTDNLTMPIATIHLSPQNACTGAVCAANENYIAPGTRKIPLAAMIPGALSAQADYMRSPNIAAMSQASLNSASVVWDVSMFLAEPAVAQGQQNAFMKAAALSSAGFLEHLTFASMSKDIQGAKPAFDAYNWCISKRLEEGKGLAKARMICGRDRGPGNVDAVTELTVAQTTGFTYLDTPGKNVNGIPTGLPTQALLTELIFNEEAASVATTPNALSVQQIIAYRDAFKNTYGDIQFDMGLGLNLGGALTHTHKIVAANSTPSKFYQALVVYKFNALRRIIYRHCDELDNLTGGNWGSIGGGGATGEIYWPVSDYNPAAGLLPGSAITNNDLKAISIPGFTMTAGAVTNLRSWYKELFTTTIAGRRTVNCAPLDNSGLYEVGSILTNAGVPGPPPFASFSNHINRLQGREFFISLYQFARLLALGEWLTKAASMEQIIESLTGGIAQGDTYEEMAKDLIYRAVGSKDIKAELERTSANLRSQFVNIYERSVASAEATAQKASNMPQ